jgi:GntR family transcriptional repressor for pyruvate dehydrogenase complex
MAFESCIEQLGSAIRLGIFREGEKLPGERELAERLGVSRATLREAISALRAAGFVTTTRGRGGGTIVAPAHDEWPADQRPAQEAEVADILVFRSVIEPGAARTPVEYRRSDARLHLAIATVCGSDELTKASGLIQVKIHQFLAEIPFLRKNIEGSDEQHRAIVDAIRTGDAARARDIMHAHCDATAALLKGLRGRTAPAQTQRDE